MIADTTCTRCLLPARALNIRFDKRGVCNHCSAYVDHASTLRDFQRMERLYLRRLAAVRGRHAYDALVGLSGGKDSSYVAYRLVREQGAKVLLYTYDNGFLSEHARDNVERVAKALGQDHVWCRPSAGLHRAVYRTSIRLFGIPCVGCTFPGYLRAISLAIERGIPLIVHGRSRAQMFKQLAPGMSDPFFRYLAGNFESPDTERNRAFMLDTAASLWRGLRLFAPGRALRQELKETYAPDLAKLRVMADPPEILAHFLFEPYDELRFQAILEGELGWEPPPRGDFMGHEDCRAHPVAAYLYTNNYGFPMLQQELSTLIREGDITRDEALERLALEADAWTLSAPSMATLEGVTGFDAETILRLSNRTSRLMTCFRWWLRTRNAMLGRSPLPIPSSDQAQG